VELPGQSHHALDMIDTMASLLQPHLFDDELFHLGYTVLFGGTHCGCYP
jgi:hypothetical protein